MKSFLKHMLLGAIAFSAGQSLAQALPAATPGFDFSGFGIWVVVVLVVIVIGVFLHRHPSTVTAAQDLAKGALDLAHKTADSHATVVATLPAAIAATPTPIVDVQAQIAAAVALALANAAKTAAPPPAAAAPAPVATAAPPVDPSLPPRSANQTPGDGREWYHPNAWPQGQGYFIDSAVSDPAPAAPTIPAETLERNVFLALSSTPPQERMTKYSLKLQESCGGATQANAYINNRFNPIWSAAVNQLIAGTAPQAIIDALQASTNRDAWGSIPTLAELAALQQELDTPI